MGDPHGTVSPRDAAIGGAEGDHRGSPFRPLVHFSDGGEHAMDALHHAVRLARLFDARLDVAIVSQALPAGEDILGHSGEDRLAMKQALIKRVAERAGIAVTQTILIGRPSVVGLDFARTIGCDLIVIGATIAHNIHDRLWGSRSSRIVRDGACSVLVVRSAPNNTS